MKSNNTVKTFFRLSTAKTSTLRVNYVGLKYAQLFKGAYT